MWLNNYPPRFRSDHRESKMLREKLRSFSFYLVSHQVSLIKCSQGMVYIYEDN